MDNFLIICLITFTQNNYFKMASFVSTWIIFVFVFFKFKFVGLGHCDLCIVGVVMRYPFSGQDSCKTMGEFLGNKGK